MGSEYKRKVREFISQHVLRFYVGTVIGRVQNWVYLKSPTKGKMMAETVKDTCESNGYVTPCYHSSPSYADSACVKTTGESDIFSYIQQTFCPLASMWTCSLLNEVCVYMKPSWRSGTSYCNVNNRDAYGKDISNKMSLCALEV